MVRTAYHRQTEVVKIVGIVSSTDRVVRVELADGSKPRIRRDLADFVPGAVVIPKWLADKLLKRKGKVQ